MQVHLTEQARKELFEIGEWIERDNPARAASFVEELYEAYMRLGDMPRLSLAAEPPRERYPPSASRQLPDLLHRRRVRKRLHIVHGARDYEAILFPE